MDELTRKQIHEAEQLRQNRRKALGLPAGNMAQKQLDAHLENMRFVVGPAETAYFEALSTDKVTGNPSQTVTGNDYLWRIFDSDRHPDLKKAIRVIKQFYNERIAIGGGLILAGYCGSGKSHLARAVVDLYGLQAAFCEEEALFKAIQNTYANRGPHTEQSILLPYQRSKLLVIDDIGAYKSNNIDWIQNIYYQLFNGRLEAEKATVITTNLPLIEQRSGQESSPLEERLGQRCFSRVLGQIESMDYYIDLFKVPDYRTRKFI